MESTDLLSVGEIAHRSGFAASALRYYEAEGLVTATRSPGGRRLFERGTLRRLAFIRAAANVGLSLAGDPRGARLAARRPDADQGGLVADLAALARPPRRADRGVDVTA